jgi:serine phosphatase RsbU (regulator of sigma subunit)
MSASHSKNSERILVVDDNRVNRMTLLSSLQTLGYQVELAEDGRQALEMVGTEAFDLMLLDILMPEMDGFEVLDHLQASGQLHELPVIVVSSVDDMDSIVRGIEMGAEDYLPKPFNATLLRARIGASLEKKRLRDAEKAVVEREYRTAKGIQLGMLPKALPSVPGWDFGASISAARQVGGDFYDFIDVGYGKLGIIVGDVSDKGVPSALVMAMFVTLMRSEARYEPSPAKLMHIVNNRMMESTPNAGFITLLYGVLDVSSGTFNYARAGHHLPLLINEIGEVREPTSEIGQPVGIFPEPLIDEQTIQLSNGTTVVLYTDGIPDATDLEGKTFGDKRFWDRLSSDAQGTPQSICDQLVTDLIEFQKPHGQFDDMTILAFRPNKVDPS